MRRILAAVIFTPDQRVRVFVSSTLEELAEERASARQAIENLRLTPVMFELGARPHPPRDLYRTYLEQSDVFVGIYGERYGWVAPEAEISGLEDEYRLAEGLPRLLYVKRPAPERDPRLQTLVERIENESAVSYKTFAEPAELGALLEDDLALLLSERFGARAPLPLTSLPAPVDSFVGRAQELDELDHLLAEPDRRLVTVTGPGGVGKTRLAVEAARRAAPRYADGVVLVPLAPIADADLVAATICERLGAHYGSRAPLLAAIDALRDTEVLLLLDNFEHVLAAAPEVEQLLESTPRLNVLATSRSVLKLRGERELRIDPLEEADAVSLFADRGSVELTGDTRAAVAEICRRLEGIPLALELAAAQTRLLSPATILERLAGPLSLRAAGGPSYPDRHRTVEAAVDWSYELLDDDARVLCRRAGIFRGGFTLDALEAVADAADILEPLATLVESSLVQRVQEQRYSMLETIRTYAVDRLDEQGELEQVRDRHAAFYAGMLDEAGGSLRRAGHEPTLAALDAEADNIRAALDWLLEGGEGERVVAGAWALLPYWSFRERIVEGRRWFADARERGGPAARSIVGEGLLALWGSDYLAAVPLLVEGLGLARDEADEEAAAMAELGVGTLETMRGAEHGVSMIEASRRRFRDLGDEWAETVATIGLAWGLNAAETEAPLELYETTVAKAARVGFEAETVAMGALGRRHAVRGEAADAKRVLAAALERTTALRAHIGTALYVDILADLAAAEGKDVLAARLSAAAESGAEAAGAALPALSGNRTARLRGLRERLGDEAFDAEAEAGKALALEDAAAEARGFALG